MGNRREKGGKKGSGEAQQAPLREGPKPTALRLGTQKRRAKVPQLCSSDGVEGPCSDGDRGRRLPAKANPSARPHDEEKYEEVMSVPP